MNRGIVGAPKKALDTLAKSAAGSRWLTLSAGEQVLTVSRTALDESDNVTVRALESAPIEPPAEWSQLCLLLEPPASRLIEALESAMGRSACFAWPEELSRPSASGLEPFARLIIGQTEWTVASRRGDPGRSTRTLAAAPEPSADDLIEDLDARERWFKKRH